MKESVVHKLLSLNKDFYGDFARPFADSRSSPQPGFQRLVAYLPEACNTVLDVGCGNGRMGRFLMNVCPSLQYTGIDFTADLLTTAKKNVPGDYYLRDISQAGFLEGMGDFDLIVCLATMQHIPGRSNRIAVLKEMAKHLAQGGRIFLSNWQFLASNRQRRKIRDWAEVGVSENDVDPGDYLLTWKREGRGLRYVCAIDGEETTCLAEAAGLYRLAHFRSDGKEGNLNLYTVLAPVEKGNN